MRNRLTKIRALVAALVAILAAFAVAQCAGNIVIFSEDFEGSPTILDDGGANLGGNATNANHREIGFGDWAGRTLGNGNGIYQIGANGTTVLELDSGNANRRGAGLVLDPAAFATTGAGDYVLTFDVDGYTGAVGNGTASVWRGSGYNVTPGSTNNSRLIIDTAEPELRSGVPTQLSVLSRGSAIATSLGETDFTGTGSQSISFTYDGTSAIGLIFGSELGPEVMIDNIVMEFITPVPEPTSLLLFGICCLPVVSRRRGNLH